MSDAEELRVRGNALYQEGRFDDARAVYTNAIELLTSSDGGSDSRLQLAALYSNRAQTAVQERNFALALQDSVRALEYDPENEKAQLRRLVSLENLERFESAFRLVEALLDSSDTRKKHPALFDYAVAARRRLRKNIQQDKAAANKEQHAIARMVHENQKLRINFGCLIPPRVQLGSFFDVSVNIGNEFGLFRRDYLPEGECIKLRCVLRNNDDSAFKLVFRRASSASSAVSVGTDALKTPEGDTGVVTLNDRGKALFELAIESVDGSHAESVGRENMAIALTVHSESEAKWNLLPIVSLPFSLTASSSSRVDESELHDESTVALGIHCCRPVWLPTLSRELLLAESPGNLGIGGKLWDSCLVLTNYLARHKHELANKRVIELGSGLGLVGMFCALMGASDVTLTDIDEVVPLIDYNIRLNFPNTSKSPQAAAHFWGSSIDSLPHHSDVIVMSDVVYDPEGYAPLVASLEALTTSPETTIFMAHRSRNPMEHQFFEMLDRAFDYELVDWAAEEHLQAEKEKSARAGLTEKPASKDELVLQDVKIFRIKLRHDK